MSTPRLSPTEALEKFQSAIQASIEAAEVAAFDATQTKEAENIVSECIEEFARNIYEPATEDHFEHSDGVEEVIWNMDLSPLDIDEFHDSCWEAAGANRVAIYYSDAWDFVTCNTELCDQAAQEFGAEFSANEGLSSFISACARYGLMLDVSGSTFHVYEAFKTTLAEKLDWIYELRDELAELEENQEI